MSKDKPITIYGVQIQSLGESVEAIVLHGMATLGLAGQPFLDSSDKRLLIAFVVENGGLHFRNCVRDLSRILDVSRTTIYSVINSTTLNLSTDR